MSQISQPNLRKPDLLSSPDQLSPIRNSEKNLREGMLLSPSQLFEQTQQSSIQQTKTKSFIVKRKQKQPQTLIIRSVDQNIYHSTNFLPDLSSAQGKTRTHQFVCKANEKASIFEGVPLVQFDAFVRRDKHMQFLVLRDLLKITIDKCNTFKNQIIDKAKMRKIFNLLTNHQRTRLNERIEECVALLNKISNGILQDFKGNSKESLMRQSPLAIIEPSQVDLANEENTFDKNLQVLTEMVQYLRESMDAYMVMSRSIDFKPLDKTVCYNLFAQITRLRYNLTEIGEIVRIFDKSSDDKILRIQALLPPKTSKDFLLKIMKGNEDLIPKALQIAEIKQYKTEEQTALEKHKERQGRLALLLANKFNFSKNKYQTRESKVILNHDKLEQDKALILESNQKKSKIQLVTADNRKKLAIERLKDPAHDPQMKAALKIAAQILNINMEDF